MTNPIGTPMRFSVIVADPPWQFHAYGGLKLAERHKYRGMPSYDMLPDGELQSLAVEQLAADDCALFMWATMPGLDSAIELGKAWGFEYKTVAFTWLKVNPNATDVWFNRPMSQDVWHMGLGFWTRANAELVLLFTRGHPKRLAKDISQVVVAPIGRHSAKPEEVQNRIERLVGGPYCELFARRERPGWTCIGNEIDGLDIRDALERMSHNGHS